MTPLSLRLSVLVLLALPAGIDAAAQSAAPPSAADLRTRLGRLSPFQQDEVVWLARCLYSESDRAHEQRLVAWVVRNRVETEYRGRSYREVILEPSQFSAFNAPSIRRNHILSLTPHSVSKTWRQALGIALEVYRAPASQRPFTVTTRHFYSPVSMEGGRTPHWAQAATSLPAARLGVDPHRFKFFADVDERDDPTGDDAAIRTAGRGSVASVARASDRPPRRVSLRSLRRSPRFSGRVKRPVRPHLSRRVRK